MDARDNGDPRFFDKDREWLEKQPKMTPWPAGCGMLLAALKHWLVGYLVPLRVGNAKDGSGDQETYLRRMWGSWQHHWQDAVASNGNTPTDGLAVAARIRQGRGYRGKGDLGGDPLGDVVLAESAGRREACAVAEFTRRYRGFATGQAINVRREVAEDPDDYWNRLMQKLLGNAESGGALKRFHGYCGLRNWLGTVAKRLAWKVVKPKNIGRLRKSFDERLSSWTPDDELRLSEAAARMPRWLASLAASDRALVQMCLLDRLPQKDAAAVLKRHPGNVARRLKDLQRDFLESLDC